ncbi:nucleoside diphosphate kinase, mitochondrial isoform X1 [Syngnathus typhle]|uniref:nucleoside diphosphate kinase, mitochondrial isoform X1 n=1 Tax=Syngnathus typhle TaxID=161592 RepID=UPI002A69D28D|nr:nucleoside diphosphate kinase, mitochondrial isoform X1 [Syngnathus typhle]
MINFYCPTLLHSLLQQDHPIFLPPSRPTAPPKIIQPLLFRLNSQARLKILLVCSLLVTCAANVQERTLIAVKPDGVQRRLVGQIIRRFERRGFKLVGLKMLQVSEELLSQHYCQLTQKPFYSSLVDYMTSGPVVAMVWEGHNVVQSSRMMVGPTNPAAAPAGTVRGDFSLHVSRNVVHASDSLEGAQREIELWFQGKDLVKWDCLDQMLTCEK